MTADRRRLWVILLVAAGLLALLAIAMRGGARPNGPTGATAAGPASSPTATSEIGATGMEAGRPSAVASPATCEPTDQDAYVYNPDRLAVAAACIRVSGTVEAIRSEADGDLHILLAVDPRFADLLTPANDGEELGDLVVEPVCVGPVSPPNAIAACAADPDPLSGPFPAVGARVWIEGRFVFDLEHRGWAELHPLYRWGPDG